MELLRKDISARMLGLGSFSSTEVADTADLRKDKTGEVIAEGYLWLFLFLFLFRWAVKKNE
eukprot:scaffold10821_cov199-Amphora_coffeaeformis.AAC.5